MAVTGKPHPPEHLPDKEGVQLSLSLREARADQVHVLNRGYGEDGTRGIATGN